MGFSPSHSSGAVDWSVKYTHLEFWKEAKSGDWHFRVMSKSSVKFSFKVHSFEPGLIDIWSKHLLLPWSQNFLLSDFSWPENSSKDSTVQGFKTLVGVCLFLFFAVIQAY